MAHRSLFLWMSAHVQESPGSKRRRGKDRYGVITCLSVTKWVHLNWGDAGLMRLFVKLWNSLEPGKRMPASPLCLCACVSARVSAHVCVFLYAGSHGHVPCHTHSKS